MSHYDLPINLHVDYLAGWRYLLDPTYRQRARLRWRDANWFEVVVDHGLGLLSLFFSTLMIVVLVAALVNLLL